MSSLDRLEAITKDLISIINNPHPPVPFLAQGTQTFEAVDSIENIFNPQHRDSPQHPVTSPRVKDLAAKPPRVPIPTAEAPRVGKDVPTGKHQVHPIGTNIINKFKHTLYKGTVIQYDKQHKYYLI